MGFFDSFPITAHDLLASGRHLNLIGQVNLLTQHNYELQAKLQLAESRIAELEAELEKVKTNERTHNKSSARAE
jgi:predicted RNase H-like nuclease (RuvC/YqgF family)